jgi:hypothetical protein
VDRDERIASNEAVSREINESIEEAKAMSPDRHLRMVCECGRSDCDRVIAITMAEYEQLRRDPRRFAVVREHVIPDIEEIVGGNDRFTVVEKRDGTPSGVAESTDPRA